MSKRQMKEQAAQGKQPASGAGDQTPARTNYKVGYRRPPKHTQFQKGRSGNPKGRPQGRANAKTIVSRVISEKVTVREGDQARGMTKLEGLLQAHLVKAIRGDARSASLVIGLVGRLGLFADAETETLTALSEEDDAILEEYVRSKTGPAAGKPSNEIEN